MSLCNLHIFFQWLELIRLGELVGFEVCVSFGEVVCFGFK